MGEKFFLNFLILASQIIILFCLLNAINNEFELLLCYYEQKLD